jgi:hypothetical protein
MCNISTKYDANNNTMPLHSIRQSALKKKSCPKLIIRIINYFKPANQRVESGCHRNKKGQQHITTNHHPIFVFLDRQSCYQRQYFLTMLHWKTLKHWISLTHCFYESVFVCFNYKISFSELKTEHEVLLLDNLIYIVLMSKQCCQNWSLKLAT